MASIVDVSKVLGDYMLRGWVLTDKTCRTRGCAVPLMRSPKGKTPEVYFCANCDGDPSGRRGDMNSSPNIKLDHAGSSSSSDSTSHISRSSSPPTEVSHALSSPTFTPPPETEETRRRRGQSDRASSEIGSRLLKGWAMLGDECPNLDCFGVPLVRPPKVGGEKDPRKECVICQNVYLTEVDWAGRESLIPIKQPSRAEPTAISATGSQGSQSAGDGYEALSLPQHPTSHHPRAVNVYLDASVRGSPKKQIARSVAQPVQSAPDSGLYSSPSALQTLRESSQALQLMLQTLSARLALQASSDSCLDPASIAITADAIHKVTQALAQVKNLEWSESQAQNLASEPL